MQIDRKEFVHYSNTEFEAAQKAGRLFRHCWELGSKKIQLMRMQRQAWASMPIATNELTDDEANQIVCEAVATKPQP